MKDYLEKKKQNYEVTKDQIGILYQQLVGKIELLDDLLKEERIKKIILKDGIPNRA